MGKNKKNFTLSGPEFEYYFSLYKPAPFIKGFFISDDEMKFASIDISFRSFSRGPNVFGGLFFGYRSLEVISPTNNEKIQPLMFGVFPRTHPNKNKNFYASLELGYNINEAFNLFGSDFFSDVDVELNFGHKFKTLPLTLSFGYKDIFYTGKGYGSGTGIVVKAVYGF